MLGVGGGIAAYKACTLLRLLREAGHHVDVVPTAAALQFVGEATWAALSGQPVTAGMFDTSVHDVPHVRLGQQADLVLVAPATADLLARAVAGMADDLLTSTLLTARCPVVLAPAMHTEMWEHAATVHNVALLRRRGVHVVEPAVGRLTGADSGAGRLPEPEALLAVANSVLARGGTPGGAHTTDRDLAGRRVLITAGGTREAVDPVRYLGNRSSGLQGYALAHAAILRGAEVDLIAANVSLPPPPGARVVNVTSAEQMHRAVLEHAELADAVVMAAAVADFRPAAAEAAKIKKSEDGSAPDLPLVRTADILADLVARRRDGQVIVGFAAETGDDAGTVLDHGRAKLARKGCDLLVVNPVGDGLAFGQPDNEATILAQRGEETIVPRAAKETLAHRVWDAVVGHLPA